MKAARRLLNQNAGDQEAAGLCAVCGSGCEGEPLGGVVSNNFTTWDLVFGNRASLCCAGCAKVFRDRRFRTRRLLASGGGVLELNQETFRGLIESPPETEFAVTWPKSGQKHCWLHARLSSVALGIHVGCDNRTVSGAHAEWLQAIQLVERLYAAGATKAEINQGRYRGLVVQRLSHQLETFENTLRTLRAAGIVEIVTWFCARERGIGEGETVMLSEEDGMGTVVLALLAKGSRMRDVDPIGFWAGGFLARLLRRVDSANMGAFVERMAGEINVRPQQLREVVAYVEELGATGEATALEAIRRSPRVLVAMAQVELKQMRGRLGWPMAEIGTPRLPKRLGGQPRSTQRAKRRRTEGESMGRTRGEADGEKKGKGPSRRGSTSGSHVPQFR